MNILVLDVLLDTASTERLDIAVAAEKDALPVRSPFLLGDALVIEDGLEICRARSWAGPIEAGKGDLSAVVSKHVVSL
jgi:hypothetical protein